MTKTVTSLNNVKPAIWLCLILLLAIAIRACFFIGLVSGDPQDDGLYYNYAMSIYKNGFQYLERYKNLPQDFLANPANTFEFRSMVIYPIALFFKCFGPSEYSASLWCFLCSIFSVIVVFHLGKLLHNKTTGLLAASLMAIFPLEVIEGTRILADVPLGFFTSLSILLFCHANKKEKNILYFLSGISMGLGYLTKITGIVILGVLLSFCLLETWRNKKFGIKMLVLVCGFLTIVFAESCFYYSMVGKPFMNYYIHHTAALFKYKYEPVGSFIMGPLAFFYNSGTPVYHLKHLFNLTSSNINLFGFFYFGFLISIIFSLFKRRNQFLIFFSSLLFLYFEFGFVDINLDATEMRLNYLMVFKEQRYLTPLTAPLLVIFSDFLLKLGKKNKIIVFAPVFFLLITSFVSINKTYTFYRNGLNDLRTISPFVQENSDNIFFGDSQAVKHIEIFTKYKADNLRIINRNTKMSDVCDSFLILGGSRGIELSAEVFSSALPDFAWDILEEGAKSENWVLVKECKGKSSPQRHYDLKIYHIACPPQSEIVSESVKNDSVSINLKGELRIPKPPKGFKSSIRDVIDVGDRISENKHLYKIRFPSWRGKRDFLYSDNQPVSDDGRAFRRSQKFLARNLLPAFPMIIVKRIDSAVKNQKSYIRINGKKYKEWNIIYDEKPGNWRDHHFLIPEGFVNKREMEIEEVFISSDIDINCFRIEIYQYIPDLEG